uniref:Uncharacterized protein n=1 Tax=Coccolithus braarudii TaxID=221442 RepID=A0A7S0LRK4_9EUKA
MAHEFVQLGDSVVVCGRSTAAVELARAQLSQAIVQSGQRVISMSVDVSRADECDALAAAAVRELGQIDIWINNAGVSQTPRAPLVDTPPETLASVVGCNLLGTLHGCRSALRVMTAQGQGHVFLMDGAGSRGNPTPTSAVYGATKASVPQLCQSLQREAALSGVGVHALSPGMVMTDLLLEGNRDKPRSLRIFNILADNPDTVAAWLVPRIRGAEGNGSYIKYLTPADAIWRFVTSPWRSNRLVTVPTTGIAMHDCAAASKDGEVAVALRGSSACPSPKCERHDRTRPTAGG